MAVAKASSITASVRSAPLNPFSCHSPVRSSSYDSGASPAVAAAMRWKDLGVLPAVRSRYDVVSGERVDRVGPTRRPRTESLRCAIRPEGVAADMRAVDATNTTTLERVAALNDDELLEAAAAVMNELRRRGLLFAATAAIVDWQDRWFLLQPDAEP
jgi:hypothetical protein